MTEHQGQIRGVQHRRGGQVATSVSIPSKMSPLPFFHRPEGPFSHWEHLGGERSVIRV